MLTHREPAAYTIIHRLPKIAEKLAENGDHRFIFGWPSLSETLFRTLTEIRKVSARARILQEIESEMGVYMPGVILALWEVLVMLPAYIVRSLSLSRILSSLLRQEFRTPLSIDRNINLFAKAFVLFYVRFKIELRRNASTEER